MPTTITLAGRLSLLGAVLCMGLFVGCVGVVEGGASGPRGSAPDPDIRPEPIPGDRLMRRIGRAEYGQSVVDVLEVAVETPLPVDAYSFGLSRLGAGAASVNPLAAEQYETAGRQVALDALSDPARARRLSGCAPTGVVDSACARQAIEAIGGQLFRRPLTDAEAAHFTSLADAAAAHVGSFDGGLGLAVSALLQSPRFLYHIELGEPVSGSTSRRRFSGLEIAARLASFLWNSVPDTALLDAAQRGDLDSVAGIRSELTRMLADPRARVAMTSFFDEHLGLRFLEQAVPNADETAGLAALMREETHRLLLANIFDEEGATWRDLFDRPTSFVNARLAAHYGLPVPAGAGFEVVTLPSEQRGLLSRGAVVASQGHGGRTSPTLRGRFVRERLLCQLIPPPPAGVATEISEGSGATARERLERHATDATCAGCHALMDPIGLGLEQFDAQAVFRTHEGPALIDPAGELDGTAFDDATSLGQVLRDHPVVDSCLARHLLRAAVGRQETTTEAVQFEPSSFPSGGASVLEIIDRVVTSDAFRFFEAR